MFSYLRPHHKRNGSNPNSPDPLNVPASQQASAASLQSPDFFGSSRIPDDASIQSGSPVSPYPPTLPPIPRIASRYEASFQTPLNLTNQPEHNEQDRASGRARQIADSRGSRSPLRSIQYESLSSSQDNLRGPTRDSSGAPTGYGAKGQRPADQGGFDDHAVSVFPPTAPKSSSSTLSTSYTYFSRSQSSLTVGSNDKQSLSSKHPTSLSNTQSHKPPKTRLNLRNPMSLLMRRRSGQGPENLSDESLITHRSQIVPAMTLPDDYDPRIRGNVIHDFSAPRPRRNFSRSDAYVDPSGANGRSSSLETDGPNLRMNGADGHFSGDYSSPKVEREHTPVFREHFDDDTSFEASQAAIRAETLANHDFLSRNSIPPPPGRSPPPPPPLAKDSPPPTSRLSIRPPQLEVNTELYESSTLSPVQEAISPTSPKSPEQTPKKKMSTKTPLSTRSRATSVTDPSYVPAGLPTHLTSKASRFSFQISGNDSTQEQLLEERHKQKAAANASKQARNSTNTLDDDYDEDDMYDYNMDDDEFEEPIPMMGEDSEFGANQIISPSISKFDFSSSGLLSNNPLSPISLSGELETPRDTDGTAIGFAFSESVPGKVHLPPPGQHLSGSDRPISEARGLGLLDLDNGLAGNNSGRTLAATPKDTGTHLITQDMSEDYGIGDDFYFDDGMVEDPGQGECGQKFDERVFDDPSHHLYERPAPNREASANLSDELTKALSSGGPSTRDQEETEVVENEISRDINLTGPDLVHQTSKALQSSSPNFNNLEAYHSALADAATKAEANGRFRRKDSIDIGHPSSADENDEESLSHSSRPSLVPDDGRFSQETYVFPPSDFGTGSGFIDDDYGYSDYDSALEEDPMIAEANAEALANDYEGFYGQEFGFYASAQGEAQFANGGYFGSSGLGRSVSGRNAVREPNLTPITERSEYSTRNSYISLNHFSNGPQALPSPGLAQLARMSPYGFPDDDPDMSLSQLMKLRRGAFGGSNGSLGSSAGTSPRNSSPVALQYHPRGASPMAYTRQNHGGHDSDDSPALEEAHDGGDEDDEDNDEALDAVNEVNDGSEEDDDYDDWAGRRESPTLTAANYSYLLDQNTDSSPTGNSMSQAPLPTPPPLCLHTTFSHPQDTDPSSSAAVSPSTTRHQSLGVVSPISTTSPITPSGGWRAHSRNGSAADSVTYIREQDENGGDRWVLERRRTAETGELELIGREFVEGGRI